MSSLRRLAMLILVLVYAAGLAANWLAPAHYAAQFRDAPDAAPSRKFPLGTDAVGRDVLSRLIYGTRVSLVLAPAAAILATMVAGLLGGVAGYLGGGMEAVILRAADLFVSLPWLFLLITVRAMLPLNVPPVESVLVTFLLLGLLGWAGPARVVGATARVIRRQDFVLQARASGSGGFRLLALHVLPNLKPILLAQFWISVPVFILSEANLGFLGLGVGEPVPSWGGLLREIENVQAVAANPWLLAPLALLVVVVGCFHLLTPPEDYSK